MKTKLKNALLVISMVAVPMIHAQERVAVVNPECIKRIETTYQALDKAHAKGDFLNITVNKDTPAFEDSEICNVNLEMEVKSLAEAQKLQSEFYAYLLKNTNMDVSNPVIRKLK
ncbi:hypothetical protein ACNE9Y_23990 [Pseudomonas sp. NY11226]|uniref:hypothetical protein n=1 Tax=unclassified Pseudomonas TaxID=196821 RepID=UPI0006D42FF3|nr:hypothetical protein [Pseudomonas sp. NBRC 111118]